MAAHVALSAALYLALTVARAPSVWGVGRRSDGHDPWARWEPRISANLSNQFEWPVFFHVVCLLSLITHGGGPHLPWMAWLFVVGRVLHSTVQIFSPNIRLRGLVFTVNFAAVLAMWVFLVLDRGPSAA